MKYTDHKWGGLSHQLLPSQSKLSAASVGKSGNEVCRRLCAKDVTIRVWCSSLNSIQ